MPYASDVKGDVAAEPFTRNDIDPVPPVAEKLSVDVVLEQVISVVDAVRLIAEGAGSIVALVAAVQPLASVTL